MPRRKRPPKTLNPIRRVLGNLGYLARGRMLAGLMMLGATTIMARALGPQGFGEVMLMQSYALLMRGLFNCRPFEAVVQFGVPLQDDGDMRKLRKLLHVCYRVDRSARLASTLVAVALAPLIGTYLGMNHDHSWMLATYSLVLLATGNGTADGILRLYDRFDALSWQMTIQATVSLVGAALAWAFDSPMVVYAAVAALAYASEELYMSWRGWAEYRRQLGGSGPDEGLKGARMRDFPGLRHFVWVMYWQSNMDLVPKHLAVVLAGYFLGASGAGMVRLTRQVSSVLSKPAMLVRQVVFPDLARSKHQQDGAFNFITFRIALYSGLAGLVLVVATWLFGNPFVAGIFGAKFLPAVPLLILMMLAATLDLAASPLRAAAYTLGHAATVLYMYIAATFAYMLLFVLLTQYIGLVGVGIAATVSMAIPLAGMSVVVMAGRERQMA